MYLKNEKITKTVEVAALGDPHYKEPAQNVWADATYRPHFEENSLNNCRGDFNRPFYEGSAQKRHNTNDIDYNNSNTSNLSRSDDRNNNGQRWTNR